MMVDLDELIKFVDRTPATLWGGKRGARERILEEYKSSEDSED